MKLLRNVLIVAAALVLPVLPVIAAAPAEASTSDPGFIKALHAWVPATKHSSNKALVSMGEAICHNLAVYPQSPSDGAYGSSIAVEEVNGTFLDENIQNGNPFTQAQVDDIFGVSVLELCPSFDYGVKQFNTAEDGNKNEPIPTSSAPPLPSPPLSESSPSGACDPEMNCTAGNGFQPTAQQNQVFAKDAKIVPALRTFDTTGSEYEVIFMSDAVCEELGQGFAPGPIDSVLLENLPAPLGNRAATTIIMVAATNLCPQYASVVDQWYKAGNGNPKNAFSAVGESTKPPTTTTTTITTIPAIGSFTGGVPGSAAGPGSAFGAPGGDGQPWQPAPEALIVVLNKYVEQLNSSPGGVAGSFSVWISDDPQNPAWYEMVIVGPDIPNDQFTAGGLAEDSAGGWQISPDYENPAWCEPGGIAVPASVLSDFDLGSC